MTRCKALLIAALALTVVCPASAHAGAQFGYSMASRFGLDADSDGLMDLPNTPDYAQACRYVGATKACGEFDVTLDGRASNLGTKVAPVRPTSYAWTVRGAKGQTAACRSDSALGTCRVWLREGLYDVTLTASNGALSSTSSRRIPVEDLLIVSIGDSYASGEGNPERNRRVIHYIPTYQIPYAVLETQWADDGAGQPAFGSPSSGSVEARHRRAHRTTLAASAQAALDIERADPGTSVTFVSVAASGATGRIGVYGPYSGVSYEPAIAGGVLPPQLSEVRDLVGARRIEALTVSLGGNDAGFSRVVESLLRDKDRSQVKQAISSGSWGSLGFDSVRLAGLDGLPAMYDAVQATIDLLGLDVMNVFITEYPDLTSELDGGDLVWCEEVLESIAPTKEIDADEFRWVFNNFLVPLNQAIKTWAQLNQWQYVDGISEPSAAHGVCGPKPYEPATYAGNPFPSPVVFDPWRDVRWFRNANEASIIQGPADDGWVVDNAKTKGTLHPNELGHQSIKHALLANLQLPVDIASLGIRDDNDQIIEPTWTVAPGESSDPAWNTFIKPFGDVDLIRVPIPFRKVRASVTVVPLYPWFDPLVRVFDASGTQLAMNDNVGATSVASTAAVTAASPQTLYAAVAGSGNAAFDPISGLGDAKGNSTGQYRVSVSYTVGPDDVVSGATPIALGQVLDSYAIERPGDLDLFRFTAVAGQRVRFDVFVEPLFTSKGVTRTQPGFDIQLRLFDHGGGQEFARAGGDLVYTFPTSGTYLIGVTSASAGDYFTLTQTQPSPQGQTGTYSIEARLE
jgi:hypothetical protein